MFFRRVPDSTRVAIGEHREYSHLVLVVPRWARIVAEAIRIPNPSIRAMNNEFGLVLPGQFSASPNGLTLSWVER